jgi:hypothetical protein
MAGKSKPSEIPLPESWDAHVESAILHIIARAQYAMTYSRSCAADSTNQRVRLKAENDSLTPEVAQLREGYRRERPHHRPLGFQRRGSRVGALRPGAIQTGPPRRGQG